LNHYTIDVAAAAAAEVSGGSLFATVAASPQRGLVAIQRVKVSESDRIEYCEQFQHFTGLG